MLEIFIGTKICHLFFMKTKIKIHYTYIQNLFNSIFYIQNVTVGLWLNYKKPKKKKD